MSRKRKFFDNQNETGCTAGDKCVFPHYKVDEQPNKKLKKSYFPKSRESDDKNVVGIVKSVSLLGCVSEDSDALVSQGGKSGGTRCRKSWNQFKGYDSLSLRCVCEYPAKEMSIVGKHTKFFSEVTTLLNLRTDPMKRLNDSSDVPDKHGLESC